jgi:hypothetical protein
MSVNNVPPHLQLAVAKRSLKGSSVTSWYEATSDAIENFQDFRKAFLSRYWNDNIQMKIRMEIYIGKYGQHEKKGYVDHLTEIAVKSKYLEPQMTSSEFLTEK